uniref:BHLH domain-containing protein n=1 Tax=Ditylenchus dipsaci TaxID=166011 RepID=A0A915CP37_9BILA
MTVSSSSSSTIAMSYPSSKYSLSSSTTVLHSSKIRKSRRNKQKQERTLERLRQMVGGDRQSTQLDIMQKVIDHIVDLQHELNNPIGFSARSAGEQMPTAMESVQQLILQLSTLVQFKRN